MTGRGQTTVTPTDIAEGGLHAFVMLEPYVDPAYAKQARAALARRITASGKNAKASSSGGGRKLDAVDVAAAVEVDVTLDNLRR